MIIVLEGLNGAGKSTQVSRLAAHFKSQGEDLLVFREPGATHLGEKVRELLLHEYKVEEAAIHPHAQTALFLAARAQLYYTKIIPAIDAGKMVILDRWLDSTLAYQGCCLKGPSCDEIQALSDIILNGFQPDVTFILSVPPKLAAERRARKAGDTQDRFEAEGLAFQERLRIAYEIIGTTLPGRYLIDGTKPVDQVTALILETVTALQAGQTHPTRNPTP